LGGRIGRVFAVILVIADRNVELPMWIKLVGRVAKYRPGVVVLSISEKELIGVGGQRIGGID
jgi:hypothetical protein